MSSTSFSVTPRSGNRRARSLPSVMNAMNAITYIKPYQRRASGPRWKTTGSNCGWTSIALHYLRAEMKNAAGFSAGGVLRRGCALHPGAKVVVRRRALGNHRATAREAEEKERHAGNGEHRRVHLGHGDHSGETGDADAEKHKSCNQGNDLHGTFSRIWICD